MEVKRIRAETPRRTTSRTGRPMETVYFHLSGPYGAFLDGSVYLIKFVDRATRRMRPYGIMRKSETTAYVQTCLADMNGMGRPNGFRTDNGGEVISRDYVDYCDSPGIRREYTAPGKPQQNTIVESAVWRAMKGGHAARFEIGRLGFRLFQPLRDQGEHRMAVTARGFLRATAGSAGDSFFHLGMMRVDRSTKSDAHAVKCFYLNNGHNHSSSTLKVLKSSTGGGCYSSDIVWMVPRTPVLPLSPPAGGGFSGLSGRRRADNDAGVHHKIHAVTAVTVDAVTAVSVAVHGGSAGVWPYPLEDDPVFRHADDALLGNAGGAASPVASENGVAFSHNAGLLSIAGKKESLSMLNTCGATDAGRREQLTPAVEDRGGSSYCGGREQRTPAVEDCGWSSYGEGREQVASAVEDRAEELSAEKSGGIPWAMAAMLATREGIEATLSGQRPPYKPPDLPQCYARDLKVSRNHTEAMRSEHGHLWKDFRW